MILVLGFFLIHRRRGTKKEAASLLSHQQSPATNLNHAGMHHGERISNPSTAPKEFYEASPIDAGGGTKKDKKL